ncbi:MAG: kinase-like domain-containing protein [Monoraphidium minutum]|nr:MAG: kinase-like domain-containing protein [Monoraphidium minutum]
MGQGNSSLAQVHPGTELGAAPVSAPTNPEHAPNPSLQPQWAAPGVSIRPSRQQQRRAAAPLAAPAGKGEGPGGAGAAPRGAAEAAFPNGMPTPEVERAVSLACHMCGCADGALVLAGSPAPSGGGGGAAGSRVHLLSAAPEHGGAPPPHAARRWEELQLERDVWALAAAAAGSEAPECVPDARQDGRRVRGGGARARAGGRGRAPFENGPVACQRAPLGLRFSVIPSVEAGEVCFFMCAPLCSAGGDWLGAICCWDAAPRAALGPSKLLVIKYVADRVLQDVQAAASAQAPDQAPGAPRHQWCVLSEARPGAAPGWPAGGECGDDSGSFAPSYMSEVSSGPRRLAGTSCDSTPSTHTSTSGSCLSAARWAAAAAPPPPPPGAGGGAGSERGSGSSLGSGGAWAAARSLGSTPLDQLTLGAALGAGSFGRVYMGWYHGAPVAVKLLDRTMIVMDFADKGTLQTAIATGVLCEGRIPGGALDLLAVLSTAREVASGMAYLHSLGIIHGDLTASNVLLSGRGAGEADAQGFAAQIMCKCPASNVYVCACAGEADARGFAAQVTDFGLSVPLADGQQSLRTANHGAASAMAPEVLRRGVVSRGADVYSFGVLLWQMCEGRSPWQGHTTAEVLHNVCVLQRAPALGPGSRVPECLRLLVSACTAQDPAQRPTFKDILDILTPLGQLEMI